MILSKLTSKLSLYLPHTKRTRLILVGLFISLVIIFVSSFVIWKKPETNQIATNLPTPSVETPQANAAATPITPTPTPTPKPTIAASPKIQSNGKILFGIGSQGGPAMNYRITKEAPVHMLTSWYNSPSDLEWMRVQKNDAIRRIYGGNYVVHIVTWTDPITAEIETSHGHACGVAYPVSTQIIDDMRQLAEIWKGSGQMYVTLFTEFTTYTCKNNTWIGNENYYNALKDNFRKIKDVFHQTAPGSKVAISWGGWMSRYDDTTNKAGRSFMPYFDDIMRESDFTSFQAMESDTNINEIDYMTNYLSKFGKPIMVSHYKPANSSSSVFNSDMKWLFTDETIAKLTSRGLFAFSIMHNEMLEKSEDSYQLVKAGITKYGK